MSAIAGSLRIAVVGATSLIGEAVIEEIDARTMLHAELHALEEARDIGRRASAAERSVEIHDVAAFDFSRVDLVFFCTRAAVAEEHAEFAANHAWVIDSSSAFRARADVPLVAVDVNPGVLAGSVRGLVALPGSASVALATALAPLHALAGLTRVEVATYHSVSGSGRAAMEGLASETVALLSGKQPTGRSFGRQIAFNVIPLVDVIQDNGVSREETRIMAETRRVLGLPDLELNVTAVRVPVFFGHGMAVHATFAREVRPADAAAMLRRSNGLSIIEVHSGAQVPTPATLASSPDRVYVGRMRAGACRDRSLNFWVMADNVRKCAAHNAVSAAQILVNATQ